MDRPVPAVGSQSQAVHPDVVREGLADAVGVTGVREGRGQERLQGHLQLEEGGVYVPEPRVVAQSGQLPQ